MNESPWHRHVSPIFLLLVVIAGLMVGFVVFFVLSAAVHTLGG